MNPNNGEPFVGQRSCIISFNYTPRRDQKEKKNQFYRSIQFNLKYLEVL